MSTSAVALLPAAGLGRTIATCHGRSLWVAALMEGFTGDQVCLRDRLSAQGKDKYLEWVRSISDALQAPAELRRLAAYDNVYSTAPHRVVEFTFDSPQDAATYFDRKEIGLILQSELPAHSASICIKVLALHDDYVKTTVTEAAAAHQDRP